MFEHAQTTTNPFDDLLAPAPAAETPHELDAPAPVQGESRGLDDVMSEVFGYLAEPATQARTPKSQRGGRAAKRKEKNKRNPLSISSMGISDYRQDGDTTHVIMSPGLPEGAYEGQPGHVTKDGKIVAELVVDRVTERESFASIPMTKTKLIKLMKEEGGRIELLKGLEH